MSERSVRALFLAAGLAMVAYCATHLELSTDITNFMPEESRAELAVLASRLADSELTRTMVLTVGGAERDRVVAAARELGTRLAEHPEVAWLRSGIDPEQLEHLYRVYFPRRHHFLSEQPEREIPALTRPDALRERARELRRQLALPSATLTKHVAGADPLGAFERIVRRFRDQGPRLDTHGGQLVTPDGRFAVLFLGTKSSAFDSKPQARLLSDLGSAFEEIAARHGGGLVLEASGSNRFAVAAEQSIRRDLVRIVSVSVVGVAVVFLAFLRSLRVLLLAIFPPLAGILTAATLTRLVFGRLDGLTMAFGASLIGVAIDYSIHVIDHHRLDPESSASETARRLRPSLGLGAFTTIASFAGLALTSFPGFREIGFFAMSGVAGALGVTLVVLPGLLDGSGTRSRGVPRLALRTARALGAGVRGLSGRRGALAGIPLACAVVAALFLPRLDFEDDLSALMTVDPALRAEEERVRERVARVEEGRMVVALGGDAAEAVARNSRVARELEDARESGALRGYRSLHALLWPRALQERNLAALEAVPELAGRVEAAFAAEGFRPEALAPFREALRPPLPPPLTAADLRASPLADVLRPLLVDLGDRVAAVTYLHGVRAPEALRERLAPLERTYLFDQKTFLNEIYREFRATTLEQMAVGSLLVVLVLGLRYRRMRPSLAAFLPSLLTALTLLALFAAFDRPVNLLHVMSLIMVMGMGVDYGIFVVDSAGRPESLDATMLSLLLSCLTTVFVFGTLALSEHAALRSIGLTTGVGILLSFLLAPVTLVLLRGAAQVRDR